MTEKIAVYNTNNGRIGRVIKSAGEINLDKHNIGANKDTIDATGTDLSHKIVDVETGEIIDDPNVETEPDWEQILTDFQDGNLTTEEAVKELLKSKQ